MLARRLYYMAKPWVPRSVQLALRRARIRRILPRVQNVWPIDPDSARPPVWWKGWPGGKRFAFVITHDVETHLGHDRCRQLAHIDREHGFASSFNFVPHLYPVSTELRTHLTDLGHEIGVHDLRHDGTLFSSHRRWRRGVPLINDCLRRWCARGFRAGAMHHNLEWIADLDIDYDLSTFDTDPFEAQPDGLGTIFPQWVHAQNGRPGYVELPYTLPQDFTLFVLMRHTTIDIWKRKLDWVAEHGGMALFVVHPDYLCMNDNRPNCNGCFPVGLYTSFLSYVRDTYGDACWNALPHQVATHVRAVVGAATVPAGAGQAKASTFSGKGRRPCACMLAYAFYDSDNRIRRYAETLADEGWQVDAIALRYPGQPAHNTIKGVEVYRIQNRIRDEKGKFSYLWRILRFLLWSAIYTTFRHVRRPYDIIHVHSVPDFEIFAPILPKLLGAKLILDIHDIVPEFYASKFHAGNTSLAFRLLVLIERICCSFANHVIISNDLWYEKLTKRSVAPAKCTTVLNYPVPTIFNNHLPREKTDRFTAIYPGSINYHQGLDLAIRAIHAICDKLPPFEFSIYGAGPEEKSLRDLVSKLGIGDLVTFHGLKPIDVIARKMASADLGIVPKRAEDFGNEAFSTKILEFMAVGVPVLISRTRIDQFYFNDAIATFFEPGNVNDLAAKLLTLATDAARRTEQAQAASAFVKLNDWGAKKRGYLDMVDRLLRTRSRQ